MLTIKDKMAEVLGTNMFLLEEIREGLYYYSFVNRYKLYTAEVSEEAVNNLYKELLELRKEFGENLRVSETMVSYDQEYDGGMGRWKTFLTVLVDRFCERNGVVYYGPLEDFVVKEMKCFVPFMCQTESISDRRTTLETALRIERKDLSLRVLERDEDFLVKGIKTNEIISKKEALWIIEFAGLDTLPCENLGKHYFEVSPIDKISALKSFKFEDVYSLGENLYRLSEDKIGTITDIDEETFELEVWDHRIVGVPGQQEYSIIYTSRPLPHEMNEEIATKLKNIVEVGFKDRDLGAYKGFSVNGIHFENVDLYDPHRVAKNKIAFTDVLFKDENYIYSFIFDVE